MLNIDIRQRFRSWRDSHDMNWQEAAVSHGVHTYTVIQSHVLSLSNIITCTVLCDIANTLLLWWHHLP